MLRILAIRSLRSATVKVSILQLVLYKRLDAILQTQPYRDHQHFLRRWLGNKVVVVALLRKFTRSERDRVTLHDEIEATYTSFERDGHTVLQIDTYGRKTRQVPGKQSQTIQLDRQGAEALYAILKREFRF